MANIADLSVKVGADISGALSGLSAVESKLGGLGGAAASGAAKMGTAFAAAGAVVVGAAAAAGAAGVKMAGDLEQSVANISTIKPEIDTSAVFASLNDMSTRVPQSASQLGDALYNVFSSLDVSTAGGLKLVEQFAQGAVGAATDAETFGTAVMGVMNAYGLSVDDAAHISDVFFNTVNKGVVTGQELASSLGPVTQSAKAAGVSLDVLGAMIAGVTKEGGPAAQNINNLNNLFQKITTKEAQAHISALGIATKDAQGNFRPILDVMTDLKGKLGGMTESARALALQGIFPDAQARLGAQTILSQLDFVKDALNDNINTTGSAASAYAKMSATFNSQTELLKNTALAMLTEVGGRALPLLTPMITALKDGLPGAFARIQTAAAPVVAFLQGSVFPVLGKIGESISKGLETGDLGAMFTEISTMLQGALPGIVAQLQTWGQAFVDFIAPFIPPVLTALAQMAAGVFAWITAQVPGILTTLAQWGVAFVDWVAPMIPPALAALGELIGGILGWIGEQMPAILAQLQVWGQAFVDWVAPMIPPAIAALGELAVGILGWIGEQIPGILEQLQAWGLAFSEWIGPATTQLLAGLGDLSLSILGWMTEQAPTFMERLIAEWIPAFLQWAIDVIPKLVKGLGDVYVAIGGWILETGPKIAKSAAALGEAIVEGIQEGVRRLAQPLINQLTGLATQALQAAKDAIWAHSPSEKFAKEVGESSVAGWILGLKRKGPELYKAIEDMSRKTVGVAEKTIGGAGLGDTMAETFVNKVATGMEKTIGGAGLGDVMSGASGGNFKPGTPIYPYIYPYAQGAEVGFASAGGGYGAISPTSTVGMPSSASPYGLGDFGGSYGDSKGFRGDNAKVEADTAEVHVTGDVKLTAAGTQQVQIILNLPGAGQIVAMVLAEPPELAKLADGINQYNQMTGARGG